MNEPTRPPAGAPAPAGAAPAAASDPALLVLHAVRIQGVSHAARAAARFRLGRDEAAELLLDHEAFGWVRRVGPEPSFALTDAGRAEGERLLGEELDRTGTRDAVEQAHRGFAGLNARFLAACSDWQIRPEAGDALAANDHRDWRWDERVLDELGRLGRRLGPVAATLSAALERFDGYAERYAAALARVEQGDTGWVDKPGRDSCHAVWFELHEDLLATLGIERGMDV